MPERHMCGLEPRPSLMVLFLHVRKRFFFNAMKKRHLGLVVRLYLSPFVYTTEIKLPTCVIILKYFLVLYRVIQA